MVLDVVCYRIQLVDDAGPALVAETGARLEVHFTFQHGAEAAALEPDVNPPPPPPVPVGARAAGPSRLVFDVPQGMRIEYSTAGVLGALGVLALRVAPLATPRPAAARLRGPAQGCADRQRGAARWCPPRSSADGLAVLPPPPGEMAHEGSGGRR